MMTDYRIGAVTILIGAAFVGSLVGFGSAALNPSGRATMVSATSDVAVATGLKRQRAPKAGDHWGGCNDARAAGTAPIYRGEPGYSPDMDGDADGIACEPPRD